jgi:hypothetical protein
MALEKPEVWKNIEFGDDFAFAEIAPFGTDMRDAIQHQHTVGGQLCIARAEQLAVAASDQFALGESTLRCHSLSSVGKYPGSITILIGEAHKSSAFGRWPAPGIGSQVYCHPLPYLALNTPPQ